MKIKFKKISLLFFNSLALGTFTSCSAHDTSFYMANYESYISNDLLEQIESEHSFSELEVNNNTFNVPITNFKYRTFATNEDLERNFVTNYDVAVPSMYLAAKLANEGKILTLDWSNFGLYQLDENGNKTDKKIRTAEDALTLFTDQTKKVLFAYDLSNAFKISKNEYKEKIYENAGLLNYCVPYFLQDFVLGYKSFDSWNLQNSNLDWNQTILKLKEKVNSNDIKKIAAIEDYRTLYSIAHLIEDEAKNNAEITVNPGTEKNSGYVNPNSKLTDYTAKIPYDSFVRTYEYLAKDLSHNKYYFNSDSNNILNDFADPKGAQAIMSYNGDLLYAAQGGDYYSYNRLNNDSIEIFMNWLSNNYNLALINPSFNIKFIKPDRTLILLDVMVVNRKRVQEKQHLNEAYAVLKKIGLEGSDHSLYSDNSKTQYNNSSDSQNNSVFTTKDNQFVYGPMINFDYIQYTSPLNTINNYVINSGINKNSNITNNGYFVWRYNNIKYLFHNEAEFNNFISTLIAIYSVEISELNINNFIRNITDLHKSDMYYAFMNVKSKNF
ncbi:MAG: hypothetical protein HDR31_01590 [Mycoplasma sp.]|nr:hypothetical protein [Mycoplasma sp.]